MNNPKQYQASILIHNLLPQIGAEASIILNAHNEALDEAKAPLVTLYDFMKENFDYKVDDKKDFRLLVHNVVKLLSPLAQPQAEIKKVHEEQVYGRLIRVCLECYQCSKTELDFDEWMEVRGLIKNGGFFTPVENYVPKP